MLWVALGLTACSKGGRSEAGPTVTVFAAASLSAVLPSALAEAGAHRLSVGPSSRLARQIRAGAPADVFLSADERWVDWLVEAGAVDPATRRVFALNRLVIVVPATRHGALGPSDLVGRRVALTGAQVPVGRYARAALAAAGVSTGSLGAVVEAVDVRAALAAVARGEVEAGVVYATDALLTDRVRVTHVFPAESHPPIRYVGVVTASSGAPAAARAVLDALAAPAARAALQRAGFGVPEGGGG